MALSATFTANFSSFYDAVDKADAKLKTFGDGADKVGGRLNTLANQFSGQKIVQEATIMAKAVEEIGGVTKLTEKELARLGATAQEAVAKMKALGMDVPKNLQEIADKTKGATKATTDWMGSLTKAAGVVGIAFSVNAVVDFIGSVFDAASAVKDLSDQWGVSTTAVQQWTGAAKQSGVEAVTVGKSVQFLTEKLGEGSDAYQALLKNVGLSYDQLRKMPLEDAYQEVIKAISGITDETQQLDIAQGLLGESSKKMVGAIRDGFLDAAAATSYMSEETIKRLEAAQASWEKFKNAVVIGTGEMLAATSMITESMTRSWGNFFKIAAAGIADTFTGQHTGAALVVMDQAAASTKKSIEGVAAATTTVTKTTAQVLESAAAHTKAAAAAEDHRKKIDDLAASISGAGLTQKVKDLDEATKLAVKTWGAGVLNSKELVQQVQALGQAGAALTPRLQQIYDKNLAWATVNKAVHASNADILRDLPNLARALTAYNEARFPAIAPSSVRIDSNISSLLGDGPNVAAQVSKWAEQYITAPLRRAAQESSAALSLIGVAFEAIGRTGSATFAGMMRLADQAIDGLIRYRTTADAAQKSTIALNVAAGVATFGISMLVQGGIEMYQAEQAAARYRLEIEKVGRTLRELGETPSAPRSGFFTRFLVGEDWKKQLADVQAKLEAAARAVEKAFADARGKVGELQDKLKAFGGVVPSYLRPAIEAMLKMPGIPKDLADALAGLAKDPSWKALETRAKELGIDIGKLGKTFNQARLGDIGLGFVRDLHMFEDAGSDMQTVIEGMSDELSNLYQTAKQTGVKLPDTLKPYMQTLVDQGRLLDENGQKIDHLDDDAFVHIEDTGLDDVVGILEEIAKLLRDALPKAAETGAKGVQAAFDKNPLTIHYSYRQAGESPPEGPAPPPGRRPGPQPTPDAFVDWGSVPVGSTGASSAPINITVVSQLDGRELARNQVKYIPGELNRAGV